MHLRTALLALIALLLHANAATARTGPVAWLDFDDLEPGTPRGARLHFEDAGETGIDVTIEGPALTVTDLWEFGHHEGVRGNALITWSWPQTDGISVRFSKPVSRVGVTAGDFSGDQDGPLRLRAFDCQGTELGVAEAPWADGQAPPFAPLEVSADGICQVFFTSGGPHAGSAFMDDLTFDP